MKKSNGKSNTCRRCKTLIHENSLREYCHKCYSIVEEVFNKIREYLSEYPGATAYEMEQRLDIPIHIINNFVKDGRLVEIQNEYLNIQCLRCGCLLLSTYHKYCPTCESEMKKDIQKANDELSDIQFSSKNIGKMHLSSYSRKK